MPFGLKFPSAVSGKPVVNYFLSRKSPSRRTASINKISRRPDLELVNAGFNVSLRYTMLVVADTGDTTAIAGTGDKGPKADTGPKLATLAKHAMARKLKNI